MVKPLRGGRYCLFRHPFFFSLPVDTVAVRENPSKWVVCTRMGNDMFILSLKLFIRNIVLANFIAMRKF